MTNQHYGQFCGLARAAEIVGQRWTLLILRDLSVGPRRYSDLVAGLPGIPTNTLASRLKELEDEGIVERAAPAGAELEIEPGIERLTIKGDDRLLRRALRNLLENARRYGGPLVELKVRRAGQDRIELMVCDRGPGVPEPMRERIFEAFFRLPGHAEVSGGVGLGLNLFDQIEPKTHAA